MEPIIRIAKPKLPDRHVEFSFSLGTDLVGVRSKDVVLRKQNETS